MANLVVCALNHVALGFARSCPRALASGGTRLSRAQLGHIAHLTSLVHSSGRLAVEEPLAASRSTHRVVAALEELVRSAARVGEAGSKADREM